jgi:hypothetical protein
VLLGELHAVVAAERARSPHVTPSRGRPPGARQRRAPRAPSHARPSP